LFLCRDNAALSIMAEALLREIGGPRFEVYSAGWEPAGHVDRMALAELRPGISATHLLNPKSWLEFTGEWAPRLDVVVLCDRPHDRPLPAFPGDPAICRWDVDIAFTTAEDSITRSRALQRVFWQLVRRVDGFCSATPARAIAALGAVLADTPRDLPATA
jgi:arsenate reductase (thioredoxin)